MLELVTTIKFAELPADFLLVDREVIALPARYWQGVEVEDLRHDLGLHQTGQRADGLLLVDQLQPPGVLVKISTQKCH